MIFLLNRDHVLDQDRCGLERGQRPTSYETYYKWMRAASFLYGPICPTKQNDMRINILAGPTKSLLVFFLTGTEENILFSLLEKVRIREPKFPVAMTQASLIKLTKENIIELKEKYGPGIRSHAIWVSCSCCSRVIAFLPQVYLFLPINPPF